MELIKYRGLYLYITQEVRNIWHCAPDMIKRTFLDYDHRYRKLLKSYSEIKGLEGIAALAAHGDGVPWVYRDGRKEKRVQEWIDEHDGEYAALLLSVCNPYNAEISSEKSLVFSPVSSHSNLDKLLKMVKRFAKNQRELFEDAYKREGKIFRPTRLDKATQNILGLEKLEIRVYMPRFGYLESEKLDLQLQRLEELRDSINFQVIRRNSKI